MDSTTVVPVDGTDPLVMALAWVVAYGVNRWCKKKGDKRKLRAATPVLAVLAAVALRTIITAVQGHPLTIDVILRAVAAGGVAVLSHSQVREVQKIWEEPEPKKRVGPSAARRNDTVPPNPPGESAQE